MGRGVGIITLKGRHVVEMLGGVECTVEVDPAIQLTVEKANN